MIISPDVVSLDQGSMICGRRHRNPFRYNGFIFTTVSYATKTSGKSESRYLRQRIWTSSTQTEYVDNLASGHTCGEARDPSTGRHKANKELNYIGALKSNAGPLVGLFVAHHGARAHHQK